MITRRDINYYKRLAKIESMIGKVNYVFKRYEIATFHYKKAVEYYELAARLIRNKYGLEIEVRE